MKCKSCNREIPNNSNFCLFCGNKVVEHYYDDPFKNMRIDTHNSQYSYQKKYSDTKKDNIIIDRKQTSNVSIIGLLIEIISIFILFMNLQLGITLFVIGFILVIIGFKVASPSSKFIVLFFTIFSFVIGIIASVFLIVGKTTIILDDGSELSVREYLTDIFNNSYNSSKIEGYWTNNLNGVFYISDEYYYMYSSLDYDEDNIDYSKYEIENGYSEKDNSENKIMSDKDYYYYTFKTIDTSSFQDKESKILVLKLDKKTKNELIVIDNELNKTTKYTRQ